MNEIMFYAGGMLALFFLGITIFLIAIYNIPIKLFCLFREKGYMRFDRVRYLKQRIFSKDDGWRKYEEDYYSNRRSSPIKKETTELDEYGIFDDDEDEEEKWTI